MQNGFNLKKRGAIAMSWLTDGDTPERLCPGHLADGANRGVKLLTHL